MNLCTHADTHSFTQRDKPTTRRTRSTTTAWHNAQMKMKKRIKLRRDPGHKAAARLSHRGRSRIDAIIKRTFDDYIYIGSIFPFVQLIVSFFFWALDLPGSASDEVVTSFPVVPLHHLSYFHRVKPLLMIPFVNEKYSGKYIFKTHVWPTLLPSFLPSLLILPAVRLPSPWPSPLVECTGKPASSLSGPLRIPAAYAPSLSSPSPPPPPRPVVLRAVPDLLPASWPSSRPLPLASGGVPREAHVVSLRVPVVGWPFARLQLPSWWSWLDGILRGCRPGRLLALCGWGKGCGRAKKCGREMGETR